MGRGRGKRYDRNRTIFDGSFDLEGNPIENTTTLESFEIFSFQEDGVTPTTLENAFGDGEGLFPELIDQTSIQYETPFGTFELSDDDNDSSNGFQFDGLEIEVERALSDIDYIVEEDLIGIARDSEASFEDDGDFGGSIEVFLSSEDISIDIARDDLVETEPGQFITIDVLENDVEVNDNGFEFSAMPTSSQGGIVGQVDGQILFIPGEDFVGTDSFTYDLLSQDGEATVIDTATVTVEVSESVNQPTPVTPRVSIEAIFGTLDGDIIEVQGSNQLIFTGDSDDLVDAFTGEGNNRINAGSGNDTLILRENDRFFGGDGSDRFFATSGGNNTLTGGEGADQFWIATAEFPDSTNTVTDFTIGEDVIGIAGLGIGFEQVNLTQTGNDTLISTNGNDLAVLEGIDNTNLSESDFAFA